MSLLDYNAWFTIGIITAILVRQCPQIYFDFTNKNKTIIVQGKSTTRAWHIFLLYIVILIGFLFSRLQPQSSLLVLIIGCVIFLVGIGIGFIGLITMQREIGYSEGLVCVQGGFLVDKGIYCLVRHPMRVGLFLELAGLVLLSNNPILFMLLAAVGFIQYFRTLDEEAMLLDHFGDIESRYMATVPRFNIIKSLAQLAMERLLPKVKPQTEPTVNPPFARES